MSGLVVFARKETLEILRTWRRAVLPGVLLFFAISGPPLARYTPQILQTFAGDELGALVLPTPTYLDAYTQWVTNLSQVALIALVIVYGGLVSAERRNGTALLVLTKPVSRSAFVVVKWAVNAAFVTVLLVVGTAVTWALTLATFGSAPASGVWAASLVWLVLAVLLIALMTVLSVVTASSSAAAGAGLGAYLLISIASLWEPLASWTPVGLQSQAAALASGAPASPLWPVATGLALAVGLVALAAALFRRVEL